LLGIANPPLLELQDFTVDGCAASGTINIEFRCGVKTHPAPDSDAMKKLLIITIGLLVATSAHAQGRLIFANYFGSTRAAVTNAAGELCSGSAYLADLFIAPAGTTDPLSPLFVSAGFAQPFKTFAGAGYFLGGTQTVRGHGADTLAVQVRVWSSWGGAFTTWSQARWSGVAGVEVGESNIFPLTLNIGLDPDPNLVGLKGFRLEALPIIPEPSTLALAGLGLASLVVFGCRGGASRG
jgi:hypothetical protein